jgi:RNA-directed DNA polymerase
MNEGQERLRLLGLPVFQSIEDLANLIHLDPARLNVLTLYSERFYKNYRIPKQTGGYRNISQPSKEVKAVQAWILRNILDKLSPSVHATGYLRGKSLLDNVLPHSTNRYFLSVDMENFFPSISGWRIQLLFELIGYSRQTALFLANLCTYFRHLPQGGVTSPALSNLVALKLDRRLSGLTSRRNIVFTRYADDMTFSANNRTVLLRTLPSIYQIIRSEGFEPNEPKTRFLGPRTQCRITGLVKDSSEPRFGIGRHKKTRMRAVMHNFVTGRRIDSLLLSEQAIKGWLNFLKGVDNRSYEQMSQYWSRLRARYPD